LSEAIEKYEKLKKKVIILFDQCFFLLPSLSAAQQIQLFCAI